MMIDFASDIDARPCISPQTASGNTPLVGVAVDLLLRNSCVFAIGTGSLADTDATFTILVEDSADDITYAAVDDIYLVGTEAGAAPLFSDDNQVRKVGYLGIKRYVRMTITPAANSGDAFFSVVALLGQARRRSA